MTKKQADAAPVDVEAAQIEVRALCDLPTFGVVAGRLATVPAGLVPEMRATGMVDDDPAAVEYARAELAPAEPQE
jgi:hypothetical protein